MLSLSRLALIWHADFCHHGNIIFELKGYSASNTLTKLTCPKLSWPVLAGNTVPEVQDGFDDTEPSEQHSTVEQ